MVLLANVALCARRLIFMSRMALLVPMISVLWHLIGSRLLLTGVDEGGECAQSRFMTYLYIEFGCMCASR